MLLAALIGRRVGGTAAGIAAATFAAVYPHLWLIDGVLFPEGLMVFLSAASSIARRLPLARPHRLLDRGR